MMLTSALQSAVMVPSRAETKNMSRNCPRDCNSTIPVLAVLVACCMMVLEGGRKEQREGGRRGEERKGGRERGEEGREGGRARQLSVSGFLALFLLKRGQTDRHSLCHNDGDGIIQDALSEHKHVEGGADVQSVEDG